MRGIQPTSQILNKLRSKFPIHICRMLWVTIPSAGRVGLARGVERIHARRDSTRLKGQFSEK